MSKISTPGNLSIHKNLAKLPRWVAWREEILKRKDGTEAATKIPYDPHKKGQQARIPTDPSTWGTRKQAERRWHALNGDGRTKGGVGIVLGELDADHQLIGIDLDRCGDEQDDFYPWAEEIIERFNTYTEVSPSGKGVKLFFLVSLKEKDAIQALIGFYPDGKPKTRKSFSAGEHREIAIDRARFYAVTGEQLEDTPEMLRLVSTEDVRWFIEQAGPRYLQQYRGDETTAASARDESGSGHGFRFLRDCKKRGDTYKQAKAALLADQGPAGEWARRKDNQAIKMAWDKITDSRWDNKSDSRALTTRPVSEFERMNVAWLWEPFIPLAMVTLMFGDGGVGKSTVTLDMAARLSTGRKLPLNTEDISGAVLLMTKEDDVNRIVRPRLEAAKADLSRIHMVGFNVPDDPKDFEPLDRLDTNMAELEKLVVGFGDVRLVIIDPAADFAGKFDPNVEKDVRDLLTPLTGLARRNNLSVIAIIHINKAQDQSASHRGMGSIAWRNVPRSALLIADDPDTPGRKVAVQTKTNLGPQGFRALGFTMKTTRGYARIEWEDELGDADPDVLLAKRKPKTKLDQACDFLREWLRDGSALLSAIKFRAKGKNISWETMRRAKKKLHIKHFRRVGEKNWRWRLAKRRGT